MARTKVRQRLEKNRFRPGQTVWVGYNENGPGVVVEDDGWNVQVKMNEDGVTVSCHADQVFRRSSVAGRCGVFDHSSSNRGQCVLQAGHLTDHAYEVSDREREGDRFYYFKQE